MKLLVLIIATYVGSVSAHGLGNHEAVKETGLKNLNLAKPADSILHENIRVISVQNNGSGSLSFSSWKPSIEEKQAAEDLLIDPKNLAVIRRQKYWEKSSLVGVVNGKKIEHAGSLETQSNPPFNNYTDFIDNPVTLTYSKKSKTLTASPLVVEVLVVCDKEFGDVFHHDRQKILDYLTIYFWDMNMRFKTLPTVDISFRLTGVVVISTPDGQPFIEQARAQDGRTEFGRILRLFSPWVKDNAANFPKFDLAIAITASYLEWAGGLAYVGSNCWNSGSLVFNDGGDWGSVTTGAHEIAHSLGAPHDDSIPGCTASGYIMSGGNDNFRWFFSSCSDRYITEYVTSDQAACLRRIDEPGQNVINPALSFPRPTSMDDLCKRRFGPDAFIEPEDTANCRIVRCAFPAGDGWYWVVWVDNADNAPCMGGGRCFRGRCRKPDFRVQNVGSGQCLKAPNPFAFTVLIEMADCPEYGSPLDRFAVNDTSFGKTLGTPWNSLDATQNGDRCIYTGNAEGNRLWTDVCGDNPWHGWDFVNLGNDEFALRHRITARCAKQVGNGIQTFWNCDINDRNMRWKLN